jgi:SAM-dependent methyltransferase
MTATDPRFSIPLEHLHRYAYASELLRGKRVLDLCCREGYGTRILAETAASVTGLDVDSVVVQQAAEQNRRPNLNFLVGSPLSVPLAAGHTFDAVVCFDAIDETTNPEKLISEIQRLLTSTGLLVLSVPNAASHDNLFRSKAFSADQLQGLLNSRFAHIRLLQQLVYANSVIRLDLSSNGIGAAKSEPQYLIALASNSALPDVNGSVETIPATSFLREKDKAVRALLDLKAYQDETIKRQGRQLAERKQTLASLEEAFAWHTSRIESLTKTSEYLEKELEEVQKNITSDREALTWRAAQVTDLENSIKSREEALSWRASQVQSLEAEKSRLENMHRETSAKLARVAEELEAIHVSSGWKLILRARSIRESLRRLLGKE